MKPLNNQMDDKQMIKKKQVLKINKNYIKKNNKNNLIESVC